MNTLVASFIRRYKYKANTIPFISGWQFVDEHSRAEGACVDFAWTVARLEAGSWLKLLWGLLVFKYVFVWSFSEANKKFPYVPRHMMLYTRGKGWIDSTYRYYRPLKNPIHTPLLPIPFFWAYFRGAWGALF